MEEGRRQQQEEMEEMREWRRGVFVFNQKNSYFLDFHEKEINDNTFQCILCVVKGNTSKGETVQFVCTNLNIIISILIALMQSSYTYRSNEQIWLRTECYAVIISLIILFKVYFMSSERKYSIAKRETLLFCTNLTIIISLLVDLMQSSYTY